MSPSGVHSSQALAGDPGHRSMGELQERLGEFLGLGGPAPQEVVRRALADPGFEADLITSRGAPGFLRALFDHPRTRAYALPAVEAPAPDPPAGEAPAGDPPATGGQLVAKAAGALLRWGRAGFATVDEATLARREDACLACPHLTDPQATVQRLGGRRTAGERVGTRTGGKVCGKCGCVVSRKIRMTTEACPDVHPALAGLTRWGEPVAGHVDARSAGSGVPGPGGGGAAVS
jgi:hypothetical protein